MKKMLRLFAVAAMAFATAQFRFRVFYFGNEAPSLIKILRPVAGKGERTRGAAEQFHAQVPLKCSHLLADRALGRVLFARNSRETTGFSCPNKGLHALQTIHLEILLSLYWNQC